MMLGEVVNIVVVVFVCLLWLVAVVLLASHSSCGDRARVHVVSSKAEG